MKSRQIYLRKKGKNKDGINIYALSGMIGKKDSSIHTVGTAEQLLLKLLSNPTFFTQEKKEKLNEKLLRINFRPKKKPEQVAEVRTTVITRSSEKDDSFDPDGDITLVKENLN